MIIQITMIKNELPLLEAMLPIWKKYADGFIFLSDTSTDGSVEYLNNIKNEFNILEVLEYNESDELKIETDNRQWLFDTAKKYSNNIICLDADEYLDGSLTKQELEKILEANPNTVFNLKWVQYTSVNTIRVDGPWKNNWKDRIGTYQDECKFEFAQMHSTHLPIPKNQLMFEPNQLFVAHLQWLNKNYVGIKQYFWKVTDYVNNKLHNVKVAGNEAYDASVNNFNWEEEQTEYILKIKDDIFESISNLNNYRVNYIKEQTKQHNIPNLGDWGLNIHDSIPMYFCTISDEKHYPLLLNLIGSIHKYNYYDVEQILVYNLGLTDIQIRELQNIKKVTVCEIEKTNPNILDNIETGVNRHVKGLFSWKPVIIKDALDKFPYVLYLDAGTTILKPLNNLFKHISQNGYLFFDCGHSIKWMTTQYLINKLDLNSDKNKWILEDNVFGIDAGFQGVSRKIYDSYVLPMYEFSKDILNFTDDGTCPDGWGTGRHDQTLYSILVRQLGFDINYHDNPNHDCNLFIDGDKVKFHITHTKDKITKDTTIFRSRWNLSYSDYKIYRAYTKTKYKLTVVTGIGSLNKYEKFILNYFYNIQEQIDFNSIEFIIVYSEWSNLFDEFTKFENIRFIKENEKLGVYNAWNIGIQNSTSEYITNWNVDDIRFDINNITKYDMLSKNHNIDLVYNYYTATTLEEYNQLDVNNLKYIPYPDNFHDQVLSMCMAGPDPMWRKSAHLFLGLFDYKEFSIIGDWEMWVRMAAYGLKFKLLPYVLCIYIDHLDTVSKSNNDKTEQQKTKLMVKYKK